MIRTTHPSPRRRGTVIAIVVLLIAAINVTTIAVLYGGADDASVGVLRVESVRAFYAADAGVRVVTKLRANNATLPSPGATLTVPTGTAEYEVVPATATTAGMLRVRGMSGDAQRFARRDY
jgi:hypothetical protein